jgi:hypothetical protein
MALYVTLLCLTGLKSSLTICVEPLALYNVVVP